MEKILRPQETRRSPDHETRMGVVRSMVEAVLNARHRAGLSLRWPLKKVVIVSSTEGSGKALGLFEELLKEQINTRKIELVAPGTRWKGIDVTIEPVMSALGPVFRGEAVEVALKLKELDPVSAKRELQEGVLRVTLGGEALEIGEDMVNFGQTLPEDIIAAGYSDGVIYIDTEMNDELRAKGYARETIRRIQEMRKELGLDVEDHITTNIEVQADIVQLLERELEDIKYNTRSKELKFIPSGKAEAVKDWKISDVNFRIGISKR